jgi:hypothetical protein
MEVPDKPSSGAKEPRCSGGIWGWIGSVTSLDISNGRISCICQQSNPNTRLASSSWDNIRLSSPNFHLFFRPILKVLPAKMVEKHKHFGPSLNQTSQWFWVAGSCISWTASCRDRWQYANRIVYKMRKLIVTCLLRKNENLKQGLCAWLALVRLIYTSDRRSQQMAHQYWHWLSSLQLTLTVVCDGESWPSLVCEE